MPEKDAVISAVESCFDYWLDNHYGSDAFVLDAVRHLKADAVAMLKEPPEIVRCKDCLYRPCIYVVSNEKTDNWYCASGKRRET